MALSNGNTSGIADASGLGNGTFTTTAQITVGNSSGVGVMLLLPCNGVWKGSMTDTTSDVVKQFGGSTVRGCPASGTSSQFGITASSGSNLRAIYEIATSSNPYFYAQGFVVNNTGGHITSTGVGLFLNGPANDGSALDSVNVNDSLDTYCAEAYNVSAATTWSHSSINCQNHGTPFYALTDSGGYVQSLTLTDMTIVHAGTGLPEILCSDTRAVTPHISYLNLDQIYTETGTDGATTQMQINGCGAVSVNDWIIKSQSSGSSAPGITVSNAYNTNLNVRNMIFRQGSGTFTYPINAVVNNYTNEIKTTDASGNFELYTPPSMPSTLGTTTYFSLTSSDTADNTSIAFGTGTSGDSSCPTPVSGTSFLCTKSSGISVSINGGAYYPYVQTLGSGTQALGTSAIPSATCAVTTLAVSGVTTSSKFSSNPSTDPTGVTGYAPSTSGSLYIWPYVTTGNINWKVCNPSSSTLTPGALSMNYTVFP